MNTMDTDVVGSTSKTETAEASSSAVTATTTTTTPAPIPTTTNLPTNISSVDAPTLPPDSFPSENQNNVPSTEPVPSISPSDVTGNITLDLPPLPVPTTATSTVTATAGAGVGQGVGEHAPPLNALNTAEIDAIVVGFAGAGVPGGEGKTPMTALMGEGEGERTGLTPLLPGSGSGSGVGAGLTGWNGFMAGRPASSMSAGASAGASASAGVNVTGESMGMGKIPDESNRSVRALSGHGGGSVAGTSSSNMGMGSRGTDSPLPPINPNQPNGPIQLPRILSQSPAPGQGGPFAAGSSSNGQPLPPPMMMGGPSSAATGAPPVRPINTNVGGPMNYPSQGLPGMQLHGPGGSLSHPPHYPPIPLPYPGNSGPMSGPPGGPGSGLGPGPGHGMQMGMGMAHGSGQPPSRIPMGWQVMPSAGGSVDAEGGMMTGTSGWSGRGSGVSTPGTSLPMPPDLLPRQLTTREAQLVDHLVRLQLFLATAPSAWQQHGTVPTGSDPYSQQNPWYNFHHSPNSEPISFVSCPHPALNRFLLPNGEHVSCAYWNGLYMITGTDIVRALAFRFEAFGRPVKTLMVKKFEEGIFSDLRNLKPGEDSSLEKPKSEFLDLLFKYGCIRTQKKQKVFYWFSVPHDRLFLDALERDLKREKDGVDTTTEIIGEPARSFRWDPTKSLFEQFAASDLSAINSTTEPLEPAQPGDAIPAPEFPGQEEVDREPLPQLPLPTGVDQRNRPFSVTLFEGSPQYKQRKKKDAKARAMKRSALGQALSDLEDEEAEGPDRLGSEYSDVKPIVDDATPDLAGGSRAPSASMPPPGPQPPVPTWKTIADESPVGRLQESHGRGGSMTSDSDGARGQSAAPSMPGVKMFRCPLDTCGRYFKRLEHLKRHVRTHTQERPYMCQRCGKRFSRSDNLTQHYKTHERQARGERASTQMTEDDEFARMLEAQVDQMAAELGYEGSIYADSAASSFYGSPAMQPAARLGSVPNLGMPAGYMVPPPPPLGRHQSVGLGMGGTSYTRMSSLGPDRNSYLFRRQASIPAYPSSRARYMSPNPGPIPRSHTRSPSFRFAQPVQRAVSVSAIPQQGYAQSFAAASPYQGNNTLPPMNGGFAPGQVQQPGFGGQMQFAQQPQDPYNGMPPPSSINGQAYAIGPDAMGGINPRNMMQQQSQPESSDMSMQGMLPSASSAGQSGQQASIYSQHSSANSQGMSMEMDVNPVGKPLPSPATMAFNGMLVSASYEPGSAVAWPTPDNQTPLPGGSRFSDDTQNSG